MLPLVRVLLFLTHFFRSSLFASFECYGCPSCPVCQDFFLFSSVVLLSVYAAWVVMVILLSVREGMLGREAAGKDDCDTKSRRDAEVTKERGRSRSKKRRLCHDDTGCNTLPLSVFLRPH